MSHKVYITISINTVNLDKHCRFGRETKHVPWKHGTTTLCLKN